MPGDAYDACSERVRRALALASQEAGRRGQATVGAGHLLLGLLRERDGAAAQALRGLGLTPATLRWAIETAEHGGVPLRPAPRGWAARWHGIVEALRPGGAPAGRPTVTPEVEAALQAAFAEVQQREPHVIATEHLLLALVREGQSGAADVLRHLDLTPAAVRGAIWQTLEQATRRAPRI
jgi:ATP-dependent Clp protease ATP-binding subunit ClpC